MRLKEILKGTRYKADPGALRLNIRGVTDDSRAATKGSLFIAKRGYKQDGAKFIAGAISNGATAVAAETRFAAPAGVARITLRDTRSAIPAIAANFYGHPSRRLKTVGVTGTNGKTTVTYILESIVKASGREAGVIGTINYRMKGSVLEAKNTTPGPVELQSMLSGMARARMKYALMEISSHALDQGRAAMVMLDAAVLTNITGDHLDYHKTMAGYAAAKKRIFDLLKSRGAAILNADDLSVMGMRRSIKKKVITYGVRCKADIHAADIELSMRGTAFTVLRPRDHFSVSTGLVGMHNVSNVLAAVAVAGALGIRRRAIVNGIASMGTVPGRLEAIDAGQPFSVFVDFAHTEDALNNVLSLLRGVARKRIVTVFGCGGDRDRKKRPLMGMAACRFSDAVVITSDNPRTEDPARIVRDIEDGIRGRYSNYEIDLDRESAIKRAIGMAGEGDIVLLAGKGHETYQIINDTAEPFDDRVVAAELLKMRYNNTKGERCVHAT